MRKKVIIKDLLDQGDKAFDEGDLETAESIYLKILDMDSAHYEACFNLGALYHEKTLFEKSLTYSEKAIAIKPTSHGACFNKGLALNMIGDQEAAVSAFSKAVELNPEYALGHYALANTLFALDRFDRAVLSYSEAIHYGVKYDNAWYSWGQTLLKLGDHTNALKCFNTLISFFNGTGEENLTFSETIKLETLYLEAGKAEYILENYENAKKNIYLAIEENPDLPEAHLYLAAMAYLAEDKDSMEKERYNIIKAAPEPYSFYSYDLLMCPSSPNLFFKKTIEKPDDDEEYEKPKMWSDGYSFSRTFEIPKLIAYCNVCGCYHHRDQLKYIMGLPSIDYSESIPTFDGIEETRLDKYQEALKQSWSKEQEKALRIRCLWLLNHPVRENSEALNLVERCNNLEALLELVSKDDEPLFFAELYRELGDFPKCLSVLSELPDAGDSAKNEEAQIIKNNAENKNIGPVKFYVEEESEEESENKPDFSYEERRENGYDIYPEAVDIFGFSDPEDYEEFDPFLSVKLSTADEALEGWATFTYKPGTFFHRYDRLFTQKEWDIFLSLEEDYKEELIWFWSIKSWALPENPEELEKYWRIKCFLQKDADYRSMNYSSHKEYVDFLTDWKKEDQHKWDEIMEDRTGWSKEESRWLDTRRDYYIWNDMLNIHIGTSDEENLIENSSDLKEQVKKDIARYENLEKKRREAFNGLYYIERGYPQWFQGQDKTPANSEGEECIFVGQIWSDYLNFCSKLLYLFYDPIDKMQIEEYDYD